MDREILQHLHASLRLCWFKAWLERRSSLRTHSPHIVNLSSGWCNSRSHPHQILHLKLETRSLFYFMDVYSSLAWSWHVWEREREPDGRTDRKSERVWVLAVFLEFPASNGRLSSWLELCQGTLCCTGAPGDKEERCREKKETLQKNKSADRWFFDPCRLSGL